VALKIRRLLKEIVVLHQHNATKLFNLDTTWTTM